MTNKSTKNDFNCNDDAMLLNTITMHTIQKPIFENHVRAFFNGALPQGLKLSYVELGYNDNLDCLNVSLQIKPFPRNATNADLRIAIEPTPADSDEIQYSIPLLRALKKFHNVDNLAFFKARMEHGKADVFFQAFKGNVLVGYFDMSTIFPIM